MLSATAICNLALIRIGIGQQISDIDTEESQEAKTCRALYVHVRDSVLEDFAWPFATKYFTLSVVEENPNGDWLYSYRTPTDCLRARRIVSGLGLPVDAGAPIAFALGMDDNGSLIYSNQDNAVLQYTFRAEEEAFFPPSFDSAFAWMLASEIAMPLAVRESLMENARQKYIASVSVSRANQLNQQDLGDLPEADYIRARY